MNPYKLLGWFLLVILIGGIILLLSNIWDSSNVDHTGSVFCVINGFDGFDGSSSDGYYCYSYVNGSLFTYDLFLIDGLWYLSSEVVSS